MNEIEAISNYYQAKAGNEIINSDNSVGTYTGNRIFFTHKKFANNLTGFKEWLKSKYDEGKPVIVYYKLATAKDLKLTEEQKAIREQKLYTYKNITNINLSDKLASIDVTYKKDSEIEHNKLQTQIDELKQLLSTTQTSALLLDNLQKEIESEVK